ncbi:MAG: phosphatidylserine decarboxylase [Alphaproteobacteria bacterium]|nr:phosphatidylserine decarboxylase [Alphaproteobacteria bacterium]
MIRETLAPIHPDGWKFVAIGIVVTLILFLLWRPGGWLALILTLWIAYFFRDPWRVTPTRPGLVVSPADGIVVALRPAPPPVELDMGSEPVPRVSVFLNLFDAHVARAPAGGTIAAREYTPGRFFNASLDKASEHNERLALRVTPDGGPDIGCVLIAGLVARRIVCPLIAGQRVAAGERIGIIRFGSRADIYLPPPYVPLVAVGQRMIAGETVIADREATEPPRQGYSH